MTMNKGSLSIQNVSLTYGKGEKRVLALDGISFEVRPNEFTVIVGPSGCGKSSLLYIAAGLNAATQGAISTGGRVIDSPGADDPATKRLADTIAFVNAVGEEVDHELNGDALTPCVRRSWLSTYLENDRARESCPCSIVFHRVDFCLGVGCGASRAPWRASRADSRAASPRVGSGP